MCVAGATRAPPWKTLAPQFITYPTLLSVQSTGASSVSIELISILLLASFIVLLVTGLPIVFILGSVAMVATYFLWGPDALYMLPQRAFSVMDSFTVIAIPMFIFMGTMLQKSGIADDLYEMMQKWIGGIRGGLAAGTVLICTAFAAMSGVSSTATVTMGITSLPAMLNRGYNKSIAVGCIQAGGALGILIPPSVTMVFYALIAGESVGQLFMGGVLPGIMLSSFFILYILIRCALQPKLAPSVPRSERANWNEKVISLKGIIFPVALILAVLGSIFFGVATPSEAASIGATGSFIIAFIRRKLTWQGLRDCCYTTLKVSCMALWIYIAGSAFTSVYVASGASQLIADLPTVIPLGKWGILIMIQLCWILLGCVMDIWSVTLITIPVFLPVIKLLGFDPVWFGIVFIVNMEMAYLTPPFGMNLILMKSIVPKEVTMADIYRSIGPFIALQLLGLVLVILFPEIILWLPGKIFER